MKRYINFQYGLNDYLLITIFLLESEFAELFFINEVRSTKSAETDNAAQQNIETANFFRENAMLNIFNFKSQNQLDIDF